MKLIITLIVSLFLCYKSSGQTYYKYPDRRSVYDEKKAILAETILTLEQNDRTIEVNLLGELISYSISMGDDIKSNYSGRIEKLGSIDIKYDYSDRIVKFGNVEIKYSRERMIQAGNYEILYNYDGSFKGTREKAQPYRSW